jgi:predicted amidohydrolase
MANQAGTNSSGTLLGGSPVISPFGDLIASAEVVSAGQTAQPELLIVDVDLQGMLDRAERENSVLWNVRPEEVSVGRHPARDGLE